MPKDDEVQATQIEAAKAEARAISRACNARHSEALDYPTMCILTAILYATRRP